RVCAAKASLISIRSNASMGSSIRSRSRWTPWTGARNSHFGATSAWAYPTIRASGVSPYRSTARSLTTTVAAAPSVMPGALQAVVDGRVHERAVPEPVPEPRLRQEVRREVHVLHPAGDRDVGVTGPDLRRREHDRLQSRAADAVDRRRRRRVGEPAGERGLSS